MKRKKRTKSAQSSVVIARMASSRMLIVMSIDLERDVEMGSEGRKKRRRTDNEDMITIIMVGLRIRRQILFVVVLNLI